YTSLGLDGWTYDDVLPFYLNIENNTQLGPSEGHSKDGPMTMQMDTIDDILINTFEEAAVELGFTDEYYNDWSHVNATGIVRNYVAIKNGERESSRTTYLNQTPSNLKLYTNIHVESVLILPILHKR